jgi:transcriptional regulator with GAF, ATPase, and Fis domain
MFGGGVVFANAPVPERIDQGEKYMAARTSEGAMPCSQSNQELRRLFEQFGFVTGSDAMVPLLRQITKAACLSDITVLLEGETGTGKQLLANAIHQLDQKRRSRPFITVHCSTINETLAESELFGHERGAFSGAVSPRKGLFQAAHGGTLLLDDVNELPLALQSKLLDVLQRNVVRAVGSDREMPIDVRVIAAANKPLAQMVRRNAFRPDLYYRLKVVHLSIPPLRYRAPELCALIMEFARRHREVFPGIAAVDPELTEYLATQPFEGNVRELEHCVVRMLFAKTDGVSLGLHDWMEQRQANPDETAGDCVREAARALWKAVSQDGLSCALVLRQAEKHILEIAISNSASGRRELAQRLRTSERTLYHKLQAHGLTGRLTSDESTANG